MDWQRRMHNALEYIEENLDGNIDINILAMKALCSPYNFQRMFSFIADTTLANYIRGRRLSAAAYALVGSNQRVIDVALKYGYESATSFARAFAQFHGITPSEAKKPGANIKHYPELTLDPYGNGIEYKGDSVMTKNKKGRMILIDGVNGSGLSTTAQRLSRQLSLHSVPHRWIHEEIAEHPIRDGEFTMGDTNTVEGMDTNVQEMVKRWQSLAEAVVKSGSTYILEGCFIHAILRYFASSAYTVEQTLDYFNIVSGILTDAGTLFVYLRSPDIKATLEHVYPIRGQWWKDLILTSDDHCFNITEFNGEETIYQCWELERDMYDEVFARYRGDKLQIDVPVGSWAESPRKVMNHIGLTYIEIPPVKLINPEKLCGEYEAVISGEKHKLVVKYDSENKHLYGVAFWPYMKLVPITPNTFEMESFPITLSFVETENKIHIDVTGEYDWAIVGNTLIKLN